MAAGAVSVVAAVQLGLGVVTVGPVHQVAVVVVVFDLIERQSLRIKSNHANFKPRQSQVFKDDSWIFSLKFSPLSALSMIQLKNIQPLWSVAATTRSN